MNKLLKFFFAIYLAINTYALSTLSFQDAHEVYGKPYITKTRKLPKKISYKLPKVEEEMVFFDYSEKYKKPVKPKLKKESKKSISRNVFKKIKLPKQPTGYIDYSSIIRSAYSKPNVSSFKVVANVYDKFKKLKLDNYEVVPGHNKNLTIADEGTGEVIVPIGENTNESIFRGTINSKDVVKTNFSFSVYREDVVELTTLSNNKLSRIIDSSKVKEHTGSHILIELTDEVDSTEFSGRYKKKVFLNKKMSIVEPDGKYDYELYLDVELGNNVISYMNSVGKVAQKIITTTEGELTFDVPLFKNQEYRNLSFFQQGLSTKVKTNFNISENKIRYFNTSTIAKIVGPNTIKIKLPLRAEGFRNYLEFSNNLLIGFDKKNEIYLPDDEYISYIRNNLGLDDNDQACIIQVNLSTSYNEISIDNTSSEYTGNLDYFFLDRDGSVGKEVSSLTETIIITSRDKGVINIKLRDRNNNKYVQTYCSESLYLVEQL